MQRFRTSESRLTRKLRTEASEYIKEEEGAREIMGCVGALRKE